MSREAFARYRLLSVELERVKRSKRYGRADEILAILEPLWDELDDQEQNRMEAMIEMIKSLHAKNGFWTFAFQTIGSSDFEFGFFPQKVEIKSLPRGLSYAKGVSLIESRPTAYKSIGSGSTPTLNLMARTA